MLYTQVLTPTLPGNPGLAGFLITLPLQTCPSLTDKGQQSRKRCHVKVHSMTSNWYRVVMAGCPSCCQLVLKTSTGPHPFFNHQQTPEGRDVMLSDVTIPTHRGGAPPKIHGKGTREKRTAARWSL